MTRDRHDATDVELSPTFPVLDTLRAVGALAVLTTHVGFQTGEYLRNGLWGTFLARLDVGVALFFVLSGFLLARPWLARRALDLPRPSTRIYYEKRALRILPVYVVAVACAYLFLDDNAGSGVRAWLSSLALADTFTSKALPHGLTHMWSLAVEASFYLILPLLLLFPRPGSRWRTTPVLIVALTAVAVAWHVYSPDVDPHVSGVPGLWLPAYLTWFAAGIGLAAVHVAYQQGTSSRLVRQIVAVGEQPGVCWSIAAGLMLIAATPLAGPSQLVPATGAEALTKHLLYAGIGSAVVLSGLFAPSGLYQRAMSWRGLRHLGHVSYSVFCIHLVLLTGAFALTGIEPFTGRALEVWATTLGLSLIAAEALYRIVELPALRLQGKLRRRESPASTANRPATDASTK